MLLLELGGVLLVGWLASFFCYIFLWFLFLTIFFFSFRFRIIVITSLVPVFLKQ